MADEMFQVGTFRKMVAGTPSGALPTASSFVISSVKLSLADLMNPGGLTQVRLHCAYDPCVRSGYPMRGSGYLGGEVASFPQAEAAALVAAGIAEIVE